jgi:hypothetical protein
VVDGGDGQSYAQALAMHPAAVARLVGAVGEVLGADMSRILSGPRAPDGRSGDGVNVTVLGPSAG